MKKLATSTCIIALVAALPSTASAQAETITVGVFGGIGQGAFTTCVFDPFTAKTGIRVIADVGASAVTLNKLVAQKTAPVMDVAYMDGGVSEQAQAAGVVDKLDPTRIPNLANVLPQALHEENGAPYAAGNLFYSFGIIYNKDEVESAPTAWADLWSGKFDGQVALPSAQISMGLPFLVHVADITGGSIENIEPALENLKKVEAVAFFSSAGTVTSMLQTQEIAVAPHFSTSALQMIKADPSLAFVAPTDKAIANDSRVHLVKGAPNKEAAEQLINLSLSNEASICLAKEFNGGPTIRDVVLPEEVKPFMPWGPEGSVDNLSMPDWNAIDANRAKLTEIFESQVSGQ